MGRTIKLILLTSAFLSGCGGGGGSNIGDADVRNASSSNADPGAVQDIIDDPTAPCPAGWTCVDTVIQGGGGGGTPSAATGTATFDPPATSYPDPINVTVTVPDGAEDVQVTSDGNTPTSNCAIFDTNSTVSIPVSSEIIVRYTLNGELFENKAAYTITAATGNAATNKEMAKAWFNYQAELRQLFVDEFNDGQLPSVAQAAKLLGVVWTIEDGAGGKASWVNYQLGADNTPTSTCGKIGIVFFNYFGYEFDGFKVTGEMNGCFKADQTGNNDSKPGTQFDFTGRFNGSIVENTHATEGIVDEGTYTVTCTDAGCADGPVDVLAPNFTIAGEDGSNPDALTCN